MALKPSPNFRRRCRGRMEPRVRSPPHSHTLARPGGVVAPRPMQSSRASSPKFNGRSGAQLKGQEKGLGLPASRINLVPSEPS